MKVERRQQGRDAGQALAASLLTPLGQALAPGSLINRSVGVGSKGICSCRCGSRLQPVDLERRRGTLRNVGGPHLISGKPYKKKRFPEKMRLCIKTVT